MVDSLKFLATVLQSHSQAFSCNVLHCLGNLRATSKGPLKALKQFILNDVHPFSTRFHHSSSIFGLKPHLKDLLKPLNSCIAMQQRPQGRQHHRLELLEVDGRGTSDQVDGQEVALLAQKSSRMPKKRQKGPFFAQKQLEDE